MWQVCHPISASHYLRIYTERERKKEREREREREREIACPGPNKGKGSEEKKNIMQVSEKENRFEEGQAREILSFVYSLNQTKSAFVNPIGLYLLYVCKSTLCTLWSDLV